MQKKEKFTDMISVGSYVDKDYFLKYTEAFSNYFSITGKFVIKKQLIRDILNLSSEVKGIRFMWGLVDEFALKSTRLFLIPCGTKTDTSINTHALQFNGGYNDSKGDRHTTDLTCSMISNFVKAIKREDGSQPYKTITRGGYLGKNSLMDFLNQENDAAMEVHLGYEPSNKEIMPILTSIHKNGVFMNLGLTCPNACPEEDQTCVTSLAVTKNSVEEELQAFRNFRDNDLLQLPEGSLYYEMYYFLSPLVRSAISKSGYLEEVFLSRLYSEKIRPFGALLNQGQHLKALDILSETLMEWSNGFVTQKQIK